MARISLFIIITVLSATSGVSLEAAGSRVTFTSSELKTKWSEIETLDFDGDGLEDIMLLDPDRKNLSFFFQDTRGGFSEDPQITYSFGGTPSVLWPSERPNRRGQDILVMTHSGVSALTYVDKVTPPIMKELIARRTIVPEEKPEKESERRLIFFPLSMRTARNTSVIIVPTREAVEIWEYADDDGWHHAYSLEDALKHTFGGPSRELAYYEEWSFAMNIGDTNSDGRLDLVVSRSDFGGEKHTTSIYEQTAEGTFPRTASRSLETELRWPMWMCLEDINTDGRVDLIKNKWLMEDWFMPGTYSGKVIVRVFLSDADGNIPDEPQYLFRKNDWLPSIPVVDIDGDGHMDLVFGYSRWRFQEEVRESLLAKRIDLTLRFHLYDAGGFAEKPDFQMPLKLSLNSRNLGSLIMLDFSYGREFSTLMTLDGDFNGDGRRDLLVKDRARYASVYFFRSRQEGFSRRADMFFDVKTVSRLVAHDLNGDGISDLIVGREDRESITTHISRRR
jgi:hypothetical protein